MTSDQPPKPVSGIYKITNNINNKFYIGSASNFIKRWYRHKNRLKNNKHDNAYMQNAWNKYGEEAFKFEVLLYCDIKDLIFYEQKFLHAYWDNSNICYNIAKDAISAMKGRKASEETKKKISLQTSGKKNPRYGKTGNKSPMFGKPGTMLGKHHTEEAKIKISNFFKEHGHPNKGKHLSEEQKIKLSLARKNKCCGENNKNSKLTWKLVNKIRLEYLENVITQKQLAKKYNIPKTTVGDILRNETWRDPEYISNTKKYTCHKKETNNE